MSAATRKHLKQIERDAPEGAAIKACLEYLHGEAIKNEYRMAAHLIGAAMESIAEDMARVARTVRDLALRKAPSVSETIDWARTLLALGIDHVDASITSDTLNVLLKYQTDIEKARRELDLGG